MMELPDAVHMFPLADSDFHHVHHPCKCEPEVLWHHPDGSRYNVPRLIHLPFDGRY